MAVIIIGIEIKRGLRGFARLIESLFRRQVAPAPSMIIDVNEGQPGMAKGLVRIGADRRQIGLTRWRMCTCNRTILTAP